MTITFHIANRSFIPVVITTIPKIMTLLLTERKQEMKKQMFMRLRTETQNGMLATINNIILHLTELLLLRFLFK